MSSQSDQVRWLFFLFLILLETVTSVVPGGLESGRQAFYSKFSSTTERHSLDVRVGAWRMAHSLQEWQC